MTLFANSPRQTPASAAAVTLILAAARMRAARRYRGSGHFGRRYVAGKLRYDPLYADLLERESFRLTRSRPH